MSDVRIQLHPEALREAVDEVSMEGYWHFTARNLFYALVRSGAIAEPKGDGAGEYACFADQLGAYESEHGALSKLIRPEFLERTFSSDPLSDDLLTYAVKRVMIFERPELMLLFARNHFFMKLECILLAATGVPNHVQDRVQAQLNAGMPMDFFVIHDATVAGYALYDRIVGEYSAGESNTVQQTAITFDQVHEIATIRTTGTVRTDVHLKHSHAEDAAYLAGGHYIHLEEIPPLILMRMVYNRTVGRFDEVGFG